MRRLGYLLTLTLAIALGATSGFAQDGKLKIKVTPKQAYVFVDGQAMRDGSQTINLPAGNHTVVVANYGYKMSSQQVDIQAGKTSPLEVKLDQQGGPVNGPFGDVELKGDPRAAVLSNGDTPGYFVGHVDEFNFDWLFWHQNLLLPPGTHHLTVTHKGKTVWSGDVTVEANKKTIINLSNGQAKTVNWSKGEKLKEVPRFKTGFASAQVAVAPTTGNFSVTPGQINCGQSATLTWQSAETVDANISNVGKVDASGTQSVSPHATTTYDFSAVGPGGTVKGSGTVNVNTTVNASLTANPTELKYRKIGDKVLTQDSSTLTWQTSNADNITLDGNKVDASGNQTVKPDPSDTSQVPEGQPARTIDESKSYTLNATNVCGGSATQTASLHITGTVEPIPTVLLQSIFYPTDYPDAKHPDVGLVRSQQLALSTLADGFKKYLEYDPDAKLSIEAHADERGSRPFNQDLSERRVERIKDYLVQQGVSADKIQTAAYGKDQELDKDTVNGLETQNPNPAPKARSGNRNARGTWLAYNRRADIILLPSAKKSTQYFPNNADDAGLIWQIPKPALKKVQADQ
ncbi:MAG TPA: OmpA family protein [Candidatus Acidoferrales bacterium]|nr:OmpA family protein [Candidatus Acidoferrales bacterium]